MAYTTIKKPSDYFNTKLYTGNGSNNYIITGVGFDTDLAWIKNRGGDDHRLFDKVRGVNKFIKSNSTVVETTDAIFTTNSDGYELTNAGEVNATGANFVGWNWKANGAGVANTDGSISSTVSANTTSGFSIVSYTGTGANATVGHGLGAVPKMILVKNLDSGGDGWGVYHVGTDASNPQDKFLELQFVNAVGDASTPWNDTAPTSSVFSVGTWTSSNASGQNLIAYCFADVQGYSKFGSYTGNGSTDGTFVYTGFKPAFVMVKKTSGADDWGLFDNKRDVDNVTEHLLRANTSGAEEVHANFKMDFLSNGFKFRSTDGKMNGSGANYIYMAFAEQPLVGDNPCTAR